MHDPRPMEPDWVTSTRPEPSGLVEWSIMRPQPQGKRQTEYGENTPVQFIEQVCNLISSISINWAEITVDASQAVVPNTAPVTWYNTSAIPSNWYVDWGIKYSLPDYKNDEEEVGSDPDELISLIAYVIENGGKCTIDIQDHDPTPRYSEIGSMF